MRSHTNILSAWKTAKGVGLCFVLSLAAGWLSRELFNGKIDSADKAAAYILDLALLIMLLVLAVMGVRRWKNDQLTPAAKRVLIVSGAFLIVFFIVGWESDLSLSDAPPQSSPTFQTPIIAPAKKSGRIPKPVERGAGASTEGSITQVVTSSARSQKVERALKFYVANFSTHATNHFYVGATKLDGAETLAALVYWKEPRLLMDYAELADDASDRAQIFALNHPLKLDRDTVDTPEDIAGSTYLVTHREWVNSSEQCISKGRLYAITLDEATNLFPNTDRAKADNE